MVDGKPKRPISIWLAQTSLLILALWVASIPFQFVRDELQMFESYGITEDDWTFEVIGLIVVSVGLVLPFAIALLIAFLGLAFRRRFGRWMSIGIFFIGFVLSLAFLFLRLDEFAADQMIDVAEHAKRIFFFLLPGLFILLVFSLSLGGPEKAFFRWKKPTPVTEPPPPPTFDD